MFQITEGRRQALFQFPPLSPRAPALEANQLYDYLSENTLTHSALSLLLQMCDNWLKNMNEGKITGLISLDIEKASDSIDHEILMSKMESQFGIYVNELNWFHGSF